MTILLCYLSNLLYSSKVPYSKSTLRVVMYDNIQNNKEAKKMFMEK